MAVIKTREVNVQKGIKDVFNRIESFFRKMQEVIITSSELQEESGTFVITFNRTLKSNGEVMTINLTKVEEIIKKFNNKNIFVWLLNHEIKIMGLKELMKLVQI